MIVTSSIAYVYNYICLEIAVLSITEACYVFTLAWYCICISMVDFTRYIYIALSYTTCFLYQLKYPAPGAPNLARRVKELLTKSGVKRVDEDKKRGLDHGCWVPLMLMYPEADIPVCQLSVQSNQDGTYHQNIGKALAPLKDEGVLVMGSGSAVHNLRALAQNSGVLPWALEFDNWLKDALLEGRYICFFCFDVQSLFNACLILLRMSIFV